MSRTLHFLLLLYLVGKHFEISDFFFCLSFLVIIDNLYVMVGSQIPCVIDNFCYINILCR